MWEKPQKKQSNMYVSQYVTKCMIKVFVKIYVEWDMFYLGTKYPILLPSYWPHELNLTRYFIFFLSLYTVFYCKAVKFEIRVGVIAKWLVMFRWTSKYVFLHTFSVRAVTKPVSGPNGNLTVVLHQVWKLMNRYSFKVFACLQPVKLLSSYTSHTMLHTTSLLSNVEYVCAASHPLCPAE